MTKERWLAVVGVGEDGIDGLSPAARRLVAQAKFVVGGKRHLALAGPFTAETLIWPSPIENALPRSRPIAASPFACSRAAIHSSLASGPC